ncbi:tRNA pseudouridine(65) synthase TruC [Methylocaldum sp.]|uniref:tRNA pseudouridine(65) synthase TruC n=1 Tax=Methylocaldum sp. TaxID=1969727 RepID=UPI002D304FDB|nr:tRNA pseudouridine(65) synthase TruC [Methylocaldum sp.]HYE36361.1 tRNA pseudouridine(65) synthase TruC [Methylocaldum sp.]
MEILYQDDSLVAVDKPAGLLVHRSDIDRHETRYAMRIVRDRLDRRVYPIHRLDKPTSGVLVFALDSDTARRMTELFSGGAVEKSYLAVVRGYTDETGMIDYALEEQLDRMTDAKARLDKPAQPAVTVYRRLGIVELPFAVGRYPTARYSLLRVSPKTGRKHQIRRHMKHIFHPVVGDTSHGDGRHNDFVRAHFGCHRLLLCATDLVFTHPHTGERLHVKAPLDDTFQSIVNDLGWSFVLSEALEFGHSH